MSVDAALSLGCFIKSLVTFELDGGEEVKLGVLSDVQSLPSIRTDMALCIFNFLSSALIMAKIIIMIILGNIVIMVIYCNMFRSGQYGENLMSLLFRNSDVYCIFYVLVLSND